MSDLDTVMGWAALYGELYLSNSDKNKVRTAQTELANMRAGLASAKSLLNFASVNRKRFEEYDPDFTKHIWLDTVYEWLEEHKKETPCT
jgi:hypothetical protein